MAENDAMKRLWFASGAILTPLAANHIFFAVSGRPALYCWFNSPIASLYTQWGTVLLYALAAFVVLKLFRGQIIPAFGGVVIIIGIVELPNLAEQAFRLGGTCG